MLTPEILNKLNEEFIKKCEDHKPKLAKPKIVDADSILQKKVVLTQRVRIPVEKPYLMALEDGTTIWKVLYDKLKSGEEKEAVLYDGRYFHKGWFKFFNA